MATRRDAEVAVTLSILDRLTDREPENSQEAMQSQTASVRQLRAAVRRDLEWLLNTRRIAEDLPEQYEQVTESLYNYGLPDFSSYSVNSPRDRARLVRTLERSIAQFEPRLMQVKVIPMDPEMGAPRVLRFQIQALLRMDPAPEHISFDTVLQLSSGEYQIRGERNA